MSFNNTEKGVILIVDDTPNNLQMLFDFLEDSGFKVVVAEDGESALEMAEYAPPDLILLDVLMPGMDGFETCRRLKSNQSTQEIPIIFLTAITDKVDKVKGLKLGAVDYITKPLEHEEVLARVNIHMRLQNLTKRLTEQNQLLEVEILERKRIEAELRRQTDELTEWKNRYEALIQASGQILYDWNPHTHEVTYGGNIEQILGYTLDEISGDLNDWQDLVHPEDKNLFEREINHVVSTKKPLYLVFRVRRKDGTYITVEDKGYFVLDSAGNIARMVGFIVDITERKQAEEEREQAEQKIHEQAKLLDITTDAILVRNLDNQIQLLDNPIRFWNKGAERLYGWKATEAIGKNANELIYKHKTMNQLQDIQTSLAECGSWQGELYQLTKEGKEIIVASRWTLVRNEYGQPISILTVNTDMTEKKQLEAQFLRVQRLESIGTLASGIAHDLNNTFTPMLLSVQLLERKLLDEHSQQWLSIVKTNIKRGANLVKQVLSFARGIDGERTSLQIEPIVSEIEHIIKQTFPKSIEVRTNATAQNLWAIASNATQLHQVLMNLCINARDAMPNGGILEISAKNIWIDGRYARMNIEAKEGLYVVITVSDTGCGMEREILERIFEPFFTTKEVGKGTGLGLSTVMGIVKSHGGFINVFSEVGKGTEFQVYLPAMLTNQTDVCVTPHDEFSVAFGQLILLVDDEDAICEVTKTVLESYGYQVLIAKDGIEALTLYTQHQQEISVVLIDMMMPSMDGSTTIGVLKKINPQVKIIGVSGLVWFSQMAQIFGNSITTFLSKPYTSDELLKKLQFVLKTH
ncbi:MULTISPECIES: hybrid sensor histidine kinase/response regulator [Nostocales]|uniref:histidine kinase n=3 Tax=Nostocales TaxID=1161 RepID=A0A0C1N749_9CYAN|nr:response regulator [Tolypothrix bouteillei]KAF3885691.1 response regulator [Tolypothrix bouteillei VB521301]